MDRVVDRVVRVTTAAGETEGVAAVSWGESLMVRRPLGSIDQNSIRETELHTESRHRPLRRRAAERLRAAAARQAAWDSERERLL